MGGEFTERDSHATESNPARSAVSILRTVLRLLEDNPAIPADSVTLLEFRRAAMKLIAEIQSEHGIRDRFN
jgi:hypothetical protein